jgi:hypothetical protein
MIGAARIAPPLLLVKLFRLFGADAMIFPHHGGRFGYSAATGRNCRMRRNLSAMGATPEIAAFLRSG